MSLEPLTLALLLAWATLTGLDLVSVPQALLSRPLVAAAGAGLILGDVETALRIGVLAELFALDVLPVGAARYPDYGAGTVGAVLLAGVGPWQRTLGLAGLFVLALAALGGWSLLWVRRANGRAIRRYAAGLAAGDAEAIAAVQHRGLAGDLLRSAALAVFAVGIAGLLRSHLVLGPRFALVSAVAIGAGLAAAASGAIRAAGRGARLRWLAVGAGLGLFAAVLR